MRPSFGGVARLASRQGGTHLDAATFEDDVARLGFSRVCIQEVTSTFNNSTHHTWNVNHDGALPSLIIGLGAIPGKKTETPRPELPAWIMHGSMLTKREFLSGYQGGDGCKLQWDRVINGGHNYIIAETSTQIGRAHV